MGDEAPYREPAPGREPDWGSPEQVPRDRGRFDLAKRVAVIVSVVVLALATLVVLALLAFVLWTYFTIKDIGWNPVHE